MYTYDLPKQLLTHANPGATHVLTLAVFPVGAPLLWRSLKDGQTHGF